MTGTDSAVDREPETEAGPGREPCACLIADDGAIRTAPFPAILMPGPLQLPVVIGGVFIFIGSAIIVLAK